MVNDNLARRMQTLIDEGSDGFNGPQTENFINYIAGRHGAGELFRETTAQAIRACGLAVTSADEVAEHIYRNFIWTHFVCKMLMTVSPTAAADYMKRHFDFKSLEVALEENGPSILSGFHYSGYPIMALGLALSPSAPVITKARLDFMDNSNERISDRIVYMSDKSAPISLARALKQGTPIWLMVDVILPGVRVVETSFFGQKLNVSAGLDAIARLSGKPCLPLFWRMGDDETAFDFGAALYRDESQDVQILQDYVSSQEAYIARHPLYWLEWYSVLDHDLGVREQIKKANQEIWNEMAAALFRGRNM